MKKITSPVDPKPIKLDPDWWYKHQKEKEEAEELQRKKEEERINSIPCPNCRSTEKHHIVHGDSNNIYGPGSRSWIIDEYFVCRICGTMYKDVTKL